RAVEHAVVHFVALDRDARARDRRPRAEARAHARRAAVEALDAGAKDEHVARRRRGGLGQRPLRVLLLLGLARPAHAGVGDLRVPRAVHEALALRLAAVADAEADRAVAGPRQARERLGPRRVEVRAGGAVGDLAAVADRRAPRAVELAGAP